MSIRELLQADLTAALKNRDRAAVSTIRATLAAIANAEAVEAEPQSFSAAPLGAAGLSSDAPRRALDAAAILAVMQAEADERRAALADYERHGRQAHADRMRAELEVLTRYVDLARPATDVRTPRPRR